MITPGHRYVAEAVAGETSHGGVGEGFCVTSEGFGPSGALVLLGSARKLR